MFVWNRHRTGTDKKTRDGPNGGGQMAGQKKEEAKV